MENLGSVERFKNHIGYYIKDFESAFNLLDSFEDIQSSASSKRMVMIFCREPERILCRTPTPSFGVQRSIQTSFLLGEPAFQRTPFQMTGWPGASCVYAEVYSRLRRIYPPECLLLLNPPVLPEPMGHGSQEEGAEPLLLLFCETLVTSAVLRHAATETLSPRKPRFLIWPPGFTREKPTLVSRDMERSLTPKEAHELASLAQLTLFAPTPAFRPHSLEGLRLLNGPAPVVSDSHGWWAELPEGTFIPFGRERDDKEAWTSALKILFDSRHVLKEVSTKAQAYARGPGSIGEMARHLSTLRNRIMPPL